MTVIAALKKDDEIWLAADRLTSWGSFVRTDLANGTKLARYKNAIIGSSGRSLYGNALRYCANEYPKMYSSPFENEDDVFKFFFQFYDFVKKNYNLGSSETNDVSRLSHSQFMVVTSSRIFQISSCRDVTEFANFDAIGSGHEIIMGAIDALNGVLDDPQEILRRAFATCCRYIDNCGGEIELLNVTRELARPKTRKSLKKVAAKATGNGKAMANGRKQPATPKKPSRKKAVSK